MGDFGLDDSDARIVEAQFCFVEVAPFLAHSDRDRRRGSDLREPADVLRRARRLDEARAIRRQLPDKRERRLCVEPPMQIGHEVDVGAKRSPERTHLRHDAVRGTRPGILDGRVAVVDKVTRKVETFIERRLR